jgi:hypothetical protein
VGDDLAAEVQVDEADAGHEPLGRVALGGGLLRQVHLHDRVARARHRGHVLLLDAGQQRGGLGAQRRHVQRVLQPQRDLVALVRQALLERVDALLVLAVVGGDDRHGAGLALQVTPGEQGVAPQQALVGVLGGQLAGDGAVREVAPDVGPALVEPLPGHVGRAHRHDLLAGERLGIGLGQAGDVGEGVQLVGHPEGVVAGGVLPRAQELLEQQAPAVVADQLDLAPVELEVLVEVVDQPLRGAGHLLVRLVEGDAAQVGQDLEQVVVTGHAVGDPDGVRGDAVGRLTPVAGADVVVVAGR